MLNPWSRAPWYVVVGALALVAAGSGIPDAARMLPLAHPAAAAPSSTDPDTAALGRAIFEDRNLSIRKNQSCATCHGVAWGGTGPDSAINAAGAVYEGSIRGRFGDRKPPSHMYATAAPTLHRDSSGRFIGGNFWDGRATGRALGNPAADQAQGPFLNPAEQGLPDAACVVHRVSVASYAPLYRATFGNAIAAIPFPANTDALCGTEGARIPLDAGARARVNAEYDNIARAILAHEASPAVNTFSSKFDAWTVGRATLTREEIIGWQLFNRRGRCVTCHVANMPNPVFTDFGYDNLGTPANPDNPVYRREPGFVDLGLGGFLKSNPSFGAWEPETGKFKVPTLRNVDLRPAPGAAKAFMHNGAFRSLEEVVHFYNTRDVLPGCATVPRPKRGVNCWPPPEVSRNVNRSELGSLGLTEEEERALVAFLRTLSDGYRAP